MRYLNTKISTLAGAFMLAGLLISPAQAATKTNAGYVLDTCYTGYYNPDRGVPDTRSKDNFNLCSANATSIYDKVLRSTSKPSFAKDYVLIQVRYKRPVDGTVFNYVAINPKTKEGVVVPYEVVTDNQLPPKMKFNANNNTICINEETAVFQSVGTIEYLRPTSTRGVCLQMLPDKTWDYEMPLKK